MYTSEDVANIECHPYDRMTLQVQVGDLRICVEGARGDPSR